MASAQTEHIAGPTLVGPIPEAGIPPVESGGRGRRPALETGVLTALIAGALCYVTFSAKGGLNLEPMTDTEIVLTLVSGAVVAAAILLVGAGERLDGIWSVALLIAFTTLTAVSVIWSVQPATSWEDAGRMLAYSAVFAASVALVKLTPGRWASVIGGVTAAAVVVCTYALLTKIFPTLAPSSTYARLEEPYGYWNAIGLTAAMGAIGCLWLGARRSGHGLLSASAYPAMGIVLLTLVLAYSRGALAALAIGLVAWFAVVPLRLRGAAVLLAGAIAAGAVAGWDFSTGALSSEGVELAARAAAGHRLGALVLTMVAALTVTGVAVGFLTARRAPRAAARRRAGAILLGLLAAGVLAFVGALAHSSRGFTGSISHAVGLADEPECPHPAEHP